MIEEQHFAPSRRPKRVRYFPPLEKDVPIPGTHFYRLHIEPLSLGHRWIKYPFKRMQVGDSFFVPFCGANTVHQRARQVRRDMGYVLKVMQWKTLEGVKGIRVWRLG
jgi:hypothetical protein